MIQRLEHHAKPIALGFMSLLLMISLVLSTSPKGAAPQGEEKQLRADVVIKTLDAAAAVNGIKGIDVSKWNGSINWNRVAGDGVQFVMARASIGGEIDETFVTNATGAHSNGIKVGAYHYAKFTNYNTMLEEADLFISQLRRVNVTYPVALDIEADRGLSRSELTSLCTQFIDRVKAAGYDVMLYSYSNFFRQHLDINSLGNYKLWVANYIEEPILGQSIWQYTSYGSVAGITGRVDLNVAYTTLNTFDPENRVIRVNADISRSIKETLNQRYQVNLDLNTLEMSKMDTAIDIGLQMEVNAQFGENLAVYPYLTDIAKRYLHSIDYTMGQTKGNITYLYQVKLFYKGLYHEYPTGVYDEDTAQAIYEYQYEHGMYADGNLNQETLRMLLG